MATVSSRAHSGDCKTASIRCTELRRPSYRFPASLAKCSVWTFALLPARAKYVGKELRKLRVFRALFMDGFKGGQTTRIAKQITRAAANEILDWVIRSHLSRSSLHCLQQQSAAVVLENSRRHFFDRRFEKIMSCKSDKHWSHTPRLNRPTILSLCKAATSQLVKERSW